MEISHPQASWTLQYEEGRGTGPQKLQIAGKTLFSFMHCRIDDVSDDAVSSTRSHHFHKGGLAVFEGEGVFTQGPAAKLRQTHRIAANTVRMTYDLSWPKATPLAKGLELGSVVLSPSFQRFFVVAPGIDAPAWRKIPATGEPAVSLSPLPTAIVLENERGVRFEYGLGDDLWRWAQGLNGEYLHATSRLEISRTTGGRVALRRWVAECDSALEQKLATAATTKLQQEILKRRQELVAQGETPDDKPLPTVPVSQPEQRDYRFTAYFAWSQPELITAVPEGIVPQEVKLNAKGEFSCENLSALDDSPALLLDLAKLPATTQARRADKADAPLCWESNQAQNLYRRIIRQLASRSSKGTLVLQNLAPGWCDTGSHENRKRSARHWDICALLDQIAWTRQVMGADWTIVAPQNGLWAELPSLACLGTESGFRMV
ncbi:MAG: hypothetical protein IKO65_09465 [Victivallales bacterium]|nr:hypothetical protein [Victivallales bacterium]